MIYIDSEFRPSVSLISSPLGCLFFGCRFCFGTGDDEGTFGQGKQIFLYFSSGRPRSGHAFPTSHSNIARRHQGHRRPPTSICSHAGTSSDDSFTMKKDIVNFGWSLITWHFFIDCSTTAHCSLVFSKKGSLVGRLTRSRRWTLISLKTLTLNTWSYVIQFLYSLHWRLFYVLRSIIVAYCVCQMETTRVCFLWSAMPITRPYFSLEDVWTANRLRITCSPSNVFGLLRGRQSCARTTILRLEITLQIQFAGQFLCISWFRIFFFFSNLGFSTPSPSL